ncbi:winged helix-turn-helix domain-containing protein [bacterium]|nr:winged helix-turn-helix domain-containing protein [bacterium]RQV92383.1 MAG: winged helix family transcriptional regulator [bacterium]
MLNKKDILKKILQSDSFANSQVYQDLLSYLFEASINNITPKEYTIANEVFHKGVNFDPSHDTIVRVYMYNLRKKLEQYYSHEGVHDEIRVDLPKGHYEIRFMHRKRPKFDFIKRLYWIIPMIILLFSNAYFVYKYLLKAPLLDDVGFYRNDPIWSGFLFNNVPKQIVLGDHFFYVKDDDILPLRTIMRRDDINSEAEFNLFKIQDIERRNYIILRFPMFPRNSVWPSSDIISLFVKTKQNFKLNYSSNVTASDIKNEDIIFVGSFHTLAAFDQTFRKSKFSYQVYPNILTYHDDLKDTTITNVVDLNPIFYHTDLGVVRKIPGPNKNIVFIFTSFHETGTIGIIKYFMDPQSLKQLESKFVEKLGHVPEYFEILFRASGYDRTVYATDIIYLHEISPEENFW